MARPALLPSTADFIARMQAADLSPLHRMTAPEARAAFAVRHARMVLEPNVKCHTREVTLGQGAVKVPARIYRPNGAEGELPGLVYFHGGGWTVGDLETVDAFCHEITALAHCSVVSVDYRLAPEHPFPAALDDGDAVISEVISQSAHLEIDPTRVFVGGDSAGGNIAAALALACAETGVPLVGQVLIYPCTDRSRAHPSMTELGTGLNLDKPTMDWFWDNYVPDPALRTDPRVSPLLADMKTPSAPALIITAGNDPLADEGEAYAEALGRAGTQTQFVTFPGQIHGFAMQTALGPDAGLLRDIIAGFLSRRSRA